MNTGVARRDQIIEFLREQGGAIQSRDGRGLTPRLSAAMARWLLERRISEVSERLKRLRAELAVVDEQLTFFADAADEARLRALVSETPLADREHHEAQKHADAMAQSRADLVLAIQALERSQDELLDRLVAEHR